MLLPAGRERNVPVPNEADMSADLARVRNFALDPIGFGRALGPDHDKTVGSLDFFRQHVGDYLIWPGILSREIGLHPQDSEVSGKPRRELAYSDELFGVGEKRSGVIRRRGLHYTRVEVKPINKRASST
jgi:hypothetical protein